jgi:hypothetical protein
MPEVPKIVHSRLRAGASSAGHPDADLLTAFAEQALSPGEREGILQHLAVCGDCREVIAVALPVSESVLTPQATTETTRAAATTRPQDTARRHWFGWLGLRGVAVAAGVLVVASVLVLRPSKSAQPTGASLRTDAQNASPATDSAGIPKPAVPMTEAQASLALNKTNEALTRQPEAARTAVGSKVESKSLAQSNIADDKHTDEKPTELAKLEPGFLGGAVLLKGRRGRADLDAANQPTDAPAAPPAASGAMAGGMLPEAAGKSAGAAAQQMPPSRSESVTVEAATQTVQVNGEAGPVETSNNVTTTENAAVMGRNMETLPIEKAKAPAPSQKATTAARTKKQALGASSNYAYDASAQAAPAAWRLSEGVLQHSLDAGLTWQTVLRGNYSLLCQAPRGADIWTAGQAGTVFHSSDGGVTWTELHPTVNNQPLTADVTTVTLEKPGETVLTTITGERWTTMDNGKTWTMTGTIKK